MNKVHTVLIYRNFFPRNRMNNLYERGCTDATYIPGAPLKLRNLWPPIPFLFKLYKNQVWRALQWKDQTSRTPTLLKWFLNILLRWAMEWEIGVECTGDSFPSLRGDNSHIKPPLFSLHCTHNGKAQKSKFLKKHILTSKLIIILLDRHVHFLQYDSIAHVLCNKLFPEVNIKLTTGCKIYNSFCEAFSETRRMEKISTMILITTVMTLWWLL